MKNSKYLPGRERDKLTHLIQNRSDEITIGELLSFILNETRDPARQKKATNQHELCDVMPSHCGC